jgi:hypothetical protein
MIKIQPGMIPIADLIRDHRSLVNELAHYDYASVAPLVGGFLTLPNYQANVLRLDALAHLACCTCAGKRAADRETLIKCAGKYFVGSPLIPMEDPIEDAFIGNIASGFGNFRIFRGIEESGDFWVEQLLGSLEDTGLPEPLEPIIKHVRALLALSDAVAERLKLKRYSFGSGKLRGRLEIPQWRALIASAQAVTFSFSDIKKLGITQEDLIPFILTKEKQDGLAKQITGHSDLERHPIIQFDDNYVLACPHTITASVRRFTIEFLNMAGFLDFFEIPLHHQQVKAWFETLRHRFRFKPADMALPKPPKIFPMFYQTVMIFDQGRYAHLVLLDGNIKGQLAYANEMDRVSDEQQKAFEEHLVACSEILKKQPNYNGGMTLITRGGIGRGLLLGFRTIPDDWSIEFASLPDWNTLAGCEDMSALRLWRMLQQRRWAEAHGLKIHNINGPLNLYAAWRANGWRFLHRSMPLENPNKILALEIDFLTGTRKEVEQNRDEHSCLAHNGTDWIRVERRYPNAYSTDKTASLYFAPDTILTGQLTGSVETSARIWWVTTKITQRNADGDDTVFQLWDCLLNWMARAVPHIEKKIDNLPFESIWIEIDFTDLEKWSDHRIESFAKAATELPSSIASPAERKIMITIPADFKNEFHVPENRAERILVGCVITSIAKLAGRNLSEIEFNELLSAIFPNHKARFFHIVRTDNLVQMLAESGRPSPDFIPEEDCAQSLIGLAEEVGGVPSGGKVNGQTECLKYLEAVTNKLWERIEKGLARFDRMGVIMSCFDALAELERDDEHWSMTARAILALENDDSGALQEAEERHSKRSAASLANRLLAETAMYACQPTGRGIIPCAERLELLAHLKNLISAANHRDAISGGFMPAEVHIFPNGELDVDDQFYESVMIPYSQALFSKGFRSLGEKYESWFLSYEGPNNPETNATLSRLELPFREEYGVTLDGFVRIHVELGKQALKTNNLFLEFDEPSFMSFLKNECGLDENSSTAYLSRFSLPPRRAWDKDLPGGCKANDVWPWRFRRQLSLLMRPLVLLSDKPKKHWLVYPPLIQKSSGYILSGIAEATFPTEHFQSGAMLKFWGDQTNRQGNKFNNEVAEHAEALGFTTRREILMSALGVAAAIGDFGDIDVLAWKAGSSVVFVIECKYLRTAKTVRDVVDRLDEYRGERDDSLGKHLRRLNWLKSNPKVVCALTGIHAEVIQFKGLLVTDDLVPMQFFNGSLIPPHEVVPLNQIKNALK